MAQTLQSTNSANEANDVKILAAQTENAILQERNSRILTRDNMTLLNAQLAFLWMKTAADYRRIQLSNPVAASNDAINTTFTRSLSEAQRHAEKFASGITDPR